MTMTIEILGAGSLWDGFRAGVDWLTQPWYFITLASVVLGMMVVGDKWWTRARAPNPAKAPWYFLGLQEMLVYFDPWMAGVVYPGLIIVGLAAIPFIDTNPKGNGYYTVRERPFAIVTFMFGFLILWVVLIFFGTFLRGPNWSFFGLYQAWDPHKPEALNNIDVS